MASWTWGRGLIERSSHVVDPTGGAEGGRHEPRRQASWCGCQTAPPARAGRPAHNLLTDGAHTPDIAA
jgi:hypothetical protein